MGGNQSAELGDEARAKEAEIRQHILAQGLTPTSAGQYQVRVDICIDNETSGTIFVDVHPSWSPRGEARFRELMDAGWFDGCRFFRVIPGFMVQFGLTGEPSKFKGKVDSSNIKDDPVLAGNSRGRIVRTSSGTATGHPCATVRHHCPRSSFHVSVVDWTTGIRTCWPKLSLKSALH